MKRVSNLLMTLATLLLITVSCQQQETYTPYSDGKVTFQVSLPDLTTKAVGDESSVNMLYYEVYEVIGDKIAENPVIDGTEEFTPQQTSYVKFELINDQPYTVIFWADHADVTTNTSKYYKTDNLQQISFRENVDVYSNAEDREAFYKVVEIDNVEDLTSAHTQVSLVRPFAQLNIGTENPTYTGAGTDNELAPVSSKVTVTGLATTFNPLTGTGTSKDGVNEVVVFADYEVINDVVFVSGKEYDLAAMNYLFVPAGEATATVEYTLTLNNAAKTVVTNTIKNVPFKTNYRTNIVGNLLTSDTNYDISIDTDFGGVIDPMDILEHALENGGEVSLFSDMTLAEDFTIAADKEVTINLNGNTLNVNLTGTVNGKLSINNGKVNIGSEGWGFVAEDRSTIEFSETNIVASGSTAVVIKGNDVTVNLNKTTMTADEQDANGIFVYPSYWGDSKYNNLNITLTESTIKADYALYLMFVDATVILDEKSSAEDFWVMGGGTEVDVVYSGNKPTVKDDDTGVIINYYTKNQFALKEVLENGGTMTLDSDFTIDEAIKIEAGKDVTIDMNGNTLNVQNTCIVEGNLNISNGNINVDESGAALGFVADNGSAIKFDNVDVHVGQGDAIVTIYNQTAYNEIETTIDVVNSTIDAQTGYGIWSTFGAKYVEINLVNSQLTGRYPIFLYEVEESVINIDEKSSVSNIAIDGKRNVSIIYEGEKPKVTDDTNVTYYTKAVYDFTQALQNGTASELTLVEDEDYGTITVDELKNVTITGAEGAKMIFKTTADTKIKNVTLKSVNFEYTGATADCGVVINENAQIDNLVIDGCTITGTGAKAGRGLSGKNANATITIKNCTFDNIGYPVYAWGGYKSLTVENCTFKDIVSWAIMPQSGFDGDLTVTGCSFEDCKGGLVKAGTLTAGHTFTFTSNTVTNSTEHPNRNWFEFNTSAGTKVVSGNTMDGNAWTPSETEGLK